jgi:class 3 adenylate cyclase/tetratricopeptide (TPR) repeat protein
MLCDMEGFTLLSERIGPEQTYAIMDDVYEILIQNVNNYGGTVNEMTGDGIMALFGAPIALEDAPQRAIRSALAIHREMAKLSDRMKVEKGLGPIKMRIGIHTGPVVVGTLGNDLRVDFKAVGDTVELASIIEEMAEPGTTYTTEETFRLTEGLFRFEALGERGAKGKVGSVNVFRVIAASTRRTRFDVSAERGLTPFVGRERELELLLDGFERAKEGKGQAFSIIAEAGVGKSRLLYEFRKAIAHENVTFWEGRCLSYSRGVAYHPVIDILKSNFDIRESDADLDIEKKVKKGLKVLEIDECFTLPYFLELLSVKDSGINKIPMSPEAKKDRIIEAFNRIVLRKSDLRPLILAYEDLHWIDKSSEGALKVLLDSITGAKVFLVFTYRPEFVHTWGGKSYHSQINLNRLSNRESLDMATHLLGTEDIEKVLEELILEKTEGVPFFLEEFIKSLRDLKIIEKKDNKSRLAKDIQNVLIPSTIQDVIMARVDTLPEGAKGVLQTGSIIEREFSYELIKRVAGISELELLSHLSALKDSELIYERGIFPLSTYIFKHALTQEVVNDSLLTKKKKRLHEEIGNAIEELFKDNIDEYYGILADHFIACENYEKGAEYSRLANKKAEKTASLDDAIAYARKRIASLERLPQTLHVQKKIIDARTVLGLYYAQMTYFCDAKEATGTIIGLALKSGYKRRLSQIYAIIGTYTYMVEEDFPEAFKHLEEALKISEEVNDIVSSVLASYWFGVALSWSCEFDNATYHIRKAHDINVTANSLWGESALKSALSYWGYNCQGRVSLGYQTSTEALRLAEESGDTYSKAAAYTLHGYSCLLKGFLEEAEKYLLKGVKFSEGINFFILNAMTHSGLGETYFEIGEFQRSKDHYSKAIWFKEHARFFRSWINLSKIGLMRAKVMNRERDIALESLFTYEAENKAKQFDGEIKRYIGEILLNHDDKNTSATEDWIKKAIEADKRNGTMWHLGKDYALFAELFKRKGDQLQAKEKLNKAIEIFKECGADGWVEKYEKELIAL